MKYIFLVALLSLTESFIAQTKAELLYDIEAYQAAENEKFGNPSTTILLPKDLNNFKGLEFYPVNLDFRILAQFVRTPNEKPFIMETTTGRRPEYVKYGEAHFEIKGKKLQLNLYESVIPSNDPMYQDYLFLPFTDLTSGDGSYGGGRFLDTYIPQGDQILLNFNKAYNPYCTYNSDYSCPIPPSENDLEVRIEAGVKDFGTH